MNGTIFVTGISGLLGMNAVLTLRERVALAGCYREHPVVFDGVPAYQLDLTQADPLRAVLEQVRPAAILHTAGFVNVDACERDPQRAWLHNVEASRVVATVAAALGISLVHISTDHLFDGLRPLVTEETPLSPVNVYGRTKAEAEVVVQQACPETLIIRTNFYGWGSPLKASFSDWILSSLERRRRLRMFTDVHFTPILIQDLLDAVVALLARRARGIYHVAGRARVSKYEFALAAADVFGYPTETIEPSTLASHPLYACRPYDMSLSTAKASQELRHPMPGVREGLLRLKALEERGWRRELAQAVAPALRPAAA